MKKIEEFGEWGDVVFLTPEAAAEQMAEALRKAIYAIENSVGFLHTLNQCKQALAAHEQYTSVLTERLERLRTVCEMKYSEDRPSRTHTLKDGELIGWLTGKGGEVDRS